jgi:glycyl-tRNA synthetase beta chain
MQRRAIEDLCSLLRNKLAAACIPARSLRGYVTPRRLAIIAESLPLAQPDRTEERRGPRVGAPQPAIDGFLGSLGLAATAECEIRNTGRGEFYFAVATRSGRPAAEVLPELIRAAMAELSWPKSMRYPASSLRWVRPLTSVLCLFDGAVLPLPLDRIPVGRTTRGHRFLSPGEICVGSAADYLDRLPKAHVVLDHDLRKELIRAELDRRAADEGLAVRPDPALLDEVTGLVELPIVLVGGIDTSFQTLPSEVLATAMRTHQKYFACLAPDGRLAPRFLFVANNLVAEGGKTIVAGNERVLRARLADARFFWDQDRRVPLASRIETLSERIFHAKLGTLHDKAFRMDDLADFLVPLANADEDLAKRAIFLAKADLSTSMVREFPELQGVMGRYYALHDGEDPRVADAIVEHYKPLGPEDTCPTAPESVVVALVDKIDTLTGFFAIRETPTGSRDPFALRRAALGIIRLILENRLQLRLHDCLLVAAEPYRDFQDPSAVADAVFNFVANRLVIHLRNRDMPYDLIEAALKNPGYPPGELTEGNSFNLEQDFVRLCKRVRALQQFLASEDGANLLTAYRRASNIVAIEERRDGPRFDGEVDRALLRQPEEQALFDRLIEVGDHAGALLGSEEFEKAMTELARLRRPVDDFFDKVTVNCDEPVLRQNRLRLLSGIRATLNHVADFSQIEG